MSTRRLVTRGVLALVLVAASAGYGLTAERDMTTEEPSYHWGVPASESQAELGMSMDSAALHRASRLVGSAIKTSDGADFGRIDDIVLTPDLNGISYVVVSRGDIFGIGGNQYAIPWASLNPGINRTFVAQMTEQQLLTTRGFQGDDWPSEAGMEPAADRRTVHSRRFSRITGIPVRTAEDRRSGQIHDLVVDANSGNVVYTIVSYGGLFGLGSRLAAVPHNAINIEPAMDVARVEAPEATIKAYSFSSGQWPALASPSYSQQLAQSFGVEPVGPTGTALGFVPAEEKPATTPRGERPETRPARPTTPPTRMAEPTAAELMGTFDPANITTIRGTVTDTGKFKMAAAPGAAEKDMLWLRVRTEDGQTTLVHLGPRDYISRQNIFLVRGDEVRLTGSHVPATAAGRRVFLPTELVYGDQTLRLRSQTGTGLWQEQAAKPRAEAPMPDSEAVLGYAPAQEQPGREAGQPTTELAPTGGLIALGAFDVANPRTIEGTVTEVGKSWVPEAKEVIWLRIKTVDGQLINVQVGPRDYISNQDFFVVTGDRVRMTGWNAHSAPMPGATPVFILADIAHEDSVLRLRNRNGEPLWTGQAGETAQRGTRTPEQPMRTPEAGEMEDDEADVL